MRKLVPVVSLVLFAVACSSGSDPSEPTGEATAEGLGKGQAKACPDVAPPGEARCHAHFLVDANGKPSTGGTPSGYNPADIQAAYGLPSSTGGAGKVFAIVDAYDYPSAESDLAVYRSQFGLPPCTTANGCFKKVNQNGVQGSYPKANTGWSQEEALDLDMASATCPNCKIILVEANSASTADLGASVDTAVALGATVVSNSYGGGENGAAAADVHYTHPGVSITASSGDNGFGVEYPASSPHVTAVGGTSLHRSGSSFTETAWSGAGSGCSGVFAKPSWQHDTGCANRTVADVSAVADPNTGVSVYWTAHHSGGWLVFGGTSVAAPVIAGTYALAGDGAGADKAYANTGALHDVTSGSNGNCGGTYLCTAGAGYDGPTGLGTPNGIAAF
jgi:subtilase family serine protease